MRVLRALRQNVFARIPLGVRERLAAIAPARIRDWYVARSTDAFLLSFPKCGRTWLRLLVGRAVARHFGVEGVSLLAMDQFPDHRRGIPKIRAGHDDDPHRKLPHELQTSKASFGPTKVVLLVRDPRDVIVSLYFHESRRERRDVGDIETFALRSPGPFDTLLRYYRIWEENRRAPAAFLLVRYEDLQADTARELRRVLSFVGLGDIRHDTVADAVAFASFDSMRRLELDDAFGTVQLRPGSRGDTESFKTRRGVVGGYRDYLGPAAIRELERRMRSELPSLYGYAPHASEGEGTPERNSP
jgi:hypothetical protein